MRYFASLLKENAKQRSWEIMLSVFAFLVILPISFWLSLAKMDMDYSSAEILGQIQIFADSYFRELNPWLIAVTIVLSLVSGVRGMAFVFHKSENDLYHSLPIKREKLFLVSYVNTMLFYLVPFVICTAMSVGIVKLYEPAVTIGVADLIGYMALHMLAYFMMCNIHIFIVMVTGRTVLALLGIAGIYLVGIIYFYAGVVYMAIWFPCVPFEEVPDEILRLLCPPLNYIYFGRGVTADEYPMILAMVVVSLIAFLLAFLLYRRRPSEAAGTGIVYHGLKNVIKVLLNTLCGVAGTLMVCFMSLFLMMKLVSLLGIIALMFFLIVGYITLQLILEQDARTCKRDLPVFFVSVVCAVLWMAFFQYDICKVNGYIPKESDVESVAVAFTYDEDCEYRLANMEFEDINTVLALAERGLEESGKVDLEGNESYDFSVRYHMKDGREIQRNYTGLPTNEFVDLTDIIVDSDEYRKSTYVFGDYEYDKVNVFFSGWKAINFTGSSLNTAEQEKELIEALRKDLETISLEKVGSEVALGEIQFVISEKDKDKIREYDVSYNFTESYVNVIATLKKFGFLNDKSNTVLGGLQDGSVQISVYDNEKDMHGVIKNAEAIETVISLVGWSGSISNPAIHTPYISAEQDYEDLRRYDIILYQEEEWEINGSIEELPEAVQNAIIWDEEAEDDID